MKFKVISRSERDNTRDRRDDIVKVHRNADPLLHPFERAREYTRALNASKLSKVFAKPFIGALEGHMDGVSCMAKNPRSLVALVSGACDGEVRVWDIAFKKCIWTAVAHRGWVRGISVSNDGGVFYTCGDDKTVKSWRLAADLEDRNEDEDGDEGPRDSAVAPLNTFSCGFALQGIDCHWKSNLFASCGEKVNVWDPVRVEPVHSFEWGADSIKTVAWNPAETNLLGSCGSDRGVCFFDIRQSTPLRKLVLNMKSNKIAWNPMEPLNFTVANEDHNLYTFDMRNLQKALNIHKDHVGAVMDVSYSPTGKEFVSASYDRTIRLFKSQGNKSYQVYHTKRMQRVFCAEFTQDAAYVLSGSDDTNIRIWKSDASKPLGRLLNRERVKMNYNEKLVQRYKHVQEIGRINRHQNAPKSIKKEKAKKQVISEAKRRKTDRRLKNDPNAEKPIPERTRAIIKEFE